MQGYELNVIKYALMLSWGNDTCHFSCANNYEQSDKSAGQCAVSTLIINDYFGGIIQSGYIKELDMKHYWNNINGEIIDVTKMQFNKEYDFENIKEKTREEILSNEDTKNRYNVLNKRVKDFIKNLNEINELVENCNQCKSLVEKFSGDSIYLGNRTDILFIGEAPANNGWRKSGLLWRDVNGKLLPSGKVLQKLLNPLQIDILDISFIEAVKCFPVERKNLKTCSSNCEAILHKCILLLNPKIIIPLGEHPTRILLNTKEKFLELVGKEQIINIKNNDYRVIPIYHPSPISPKSYKDNVPIFEILKKEL